MSFGVSSSKQKASQALTPNNDFLLNNAARATGIADTPVTPYTGVLGAPVSGDMSAAAHGAQGLLDFQAPNVTAGQLTDVDISKYMNPYESSVIGAATADNDHARQLAQRDASARFAASNAFGTGSRQAVYQGEVDGQYDRTHATMVANLRAQGFSEATANAMADINRKFSADQGNQGAAVQGAGVRANAAGILGNIGQAETANAQHANDLAYQEWLRQQGAPAAGQQLINQSAGLLYSGPLSSSSGSSFGLSGTIPVAP